MGAGGSKHPQWYPGEPDAALFSFRGCLCGREENPNDGAASWTGGVAGDGSSSWDNRSPAVATTGTNGERTIESLPVVELTDWEFIANGTFCSVFSCKYRGFDVVAKRVRLDMPRNERRDALNNLWNEYECLRCLRHPNIVDVYGMCRKKREDSDTPWEETDVCLVVERLTLGTMGHLLGTTVTPKKMSDAMARTSRKKMLPMRRRLDRVLELALALEYVHGNLGPGPMMHRDLKSVNVGFAMNGRLKLIDFGLAKMIPDPDANETDTYEMTGGVGSMRYMAPELVKQEPYNTTADIYSWAVLSWEILAIKQPYSDVSEATFYKRVVFDSERPPLKKRWPKQLRDLLASAWDPDLRKRPTAKTIVMTLQILRAELVARENSRSSRLRSRTESDDGDEGQHTKRVVNSAPSTMSGDRPHIVGKGDDHDEDSDDSFSPQTMRKSSTRRHFSLRGWKSPRRKSPSHSKKSAGSFLGVRGKGGSADAAAARSDRDAGTTRTMSLFHAVLEDEDGARPLHRGRKTNSYPKNFSRPISETSQVLEGIYDYGVEEPSLGAANTCPNGTCPIHHDMFDLRDDLVKQLSKEREGLAEEPRGDSDEVSEGAATGWSGRTFHDTNVEFTRKLKEGRIKTNQAPEDAKETKMDHATEALTDAVGRAPTTDGEKRTPTQSFFKRPRNGDTVDSVAACAQVLETLDNSARSPRWGSGDDPNDLHAIRLGDKLDGIETPSTTSCSRSSMLMPDLGKPANPDGAREESPNGHLRGDGVRGVRSRY